MPRPDFGLGSDEDYVNISHIWTSDTHFWPFGTFCSVVANAGLVGLAA